MISDDKRKLVVVCYAAGDSIREAAKKAGMSTTSAHGILSRDAPSIARPGGRRPIGGERAKEVVAMYLNGATIREVAGYLGYGASTVHSLLNREAPEVIRGRKTRKR